MQDFHHGVRVIQSSSGTYPIRTINTAVIGLVGTAPAADAAKFPLNRPVLLIGGRQNMAGIGSAGTLPKALDAIYDQIGAYVIVVRVAEGANADDTTSNVIGGVDPIGNLLGMHALLASNNMFGFKPRILGCPGLDTQAVTAELTGIADKVRGFVYASAWGCADKVAAQDYRQNFGSRRLMLIWPDFTGWDTATDSTTSLSSVARAMGLRAKIDNDIGWHRSLSNLPVNGVTGISKDVYFDLQDTSTDADYLNSNEVTTLIRRDGYRFWGNRTTSSDPYYAFECVGRTDDVLADTMAEAHFEYVDRPMSRVLFKEIVESINAKFRRLKADGYIVNGEAYMDADKNPIEDLMAGKATIGYRFTAVPPLENLVFDQVITNEYLLELIP